MTTLPATPSLVTGALLAAGALAGLPPRLAPPDPVTVSARLSEWKVELSATTVAGGPVTFAVSNIGSIPHALEIEGQGIEKELAVLQPGAAGTLTVTLEPGRYEVYCPVGQDSHMKLGMLTRITVVKAKRDAAMPEMARPAAPSGSGKSIRVTGGGPVIQILPGPFPFPDSAGPILRQFGEHVRDLAGLPELGDDDGGRHLHRQHVGALGHCGRDPEAQVPGVLG